MKCVNCGEPIAKDDCPMDHNHYYHAARADNDNPGRRCAYDAVTEAEPAAKAREPHLDGCRCPECDPVYNDPRNDPDKPYPDEFELADHAEYFPREVER
jgi:hypothetical protein